MLDDLLYLAWALRLAVASEALRRLRGSCMQRTGKGAEALNQSRSNLVQFGGRPLNPAIDRARRRACAAAQANPARLRQIGIAKGDRYASEFSLLRGAGTALSPPNARYETSADYVFRGGLIASARAVATSFARLGRFTGHNDRTWATSYSKTDSKFQMGNGATTAK